MKSLDISLCNSEVKSNLKNECTVYIDDKLPEMIDTILSILNNLPKIEIGNKGKENIIQNAIDRKAPHHEDKNTIADSYILESFIEFSKNNEGEFYFVSDDHCFFENKKSNTPHKDIINRLECR